MEFNQEKFYRYMVMLEKREDVTHCLKSLRRMNIPTSLIEEIVEQVEKFLRNDNYWKQSMKLIRKLEREERCPDLSLLAPFLKDTKEMKMRWREVRIERMDEADWIKAEERKNENQTLRYLKSREAREIGKEQPKQVKIQPNFFNNGGWRKRKKKQRKRRRKAHYSQKPTENNSDSTDS